MEPIRTWLDFALLQTAAESYLDGIDLDDDDDVMRQLELGANRSTPANLKPSGSKRFTEVEAEWFTANYTIIDHLANTDSGFSATVMQNKTTGEFTFSMRSTEYQFGELDEIDFGGDWARDGRPGADGEIAEVGFAFGQLDDMEEYFDHLKNGRSWNADTEQWEINTRLDGIKNHLASPTNKINVTGHSLSSHLATAFTMMHPEVVEHTYNFNAAGIGGIRDESSEFPFREPTGADISALMQTYQEMMDFNGTLDNPLDPPAWYVDLITNFNTDDAVNLFTEFNILVNAAPGQEFENLYQDPLHLVVVAYLSNKVFPAGQGQTHIPFDGLGDIELAAATGSYLANGLDPNFFDSPLFQFVNPENTVLPITQLFGHGEFFDPQFVANSGYHKQPISIWIEDQPVSRELGFLELAPVVGDAREWWGEFGDTHSTTLIIDSLTVLDLIQQIDDSFNLEKYRGLQQAISNRVDKIPFGDTELGKLLSEPARNFFRSKLYDADALENTLNALSKLFLGEGATQLTPLLEGGGFANIDKRNEMHNRVAELSEAIEQEKSLYSGLSIASLVGMSREEIIAGAEASIAYRYALKELNPFVIESSIANETEQFYVPHNNNGVLDLLNPDLNTGTISQEYIDDRAAFLSLFIKDNVEDLESDMEPDVDLGEKYNGADFKDLSNINAPVEVSNNRTLLSTEKQYIFGSDGGDGRIEGNSKDDHLYGGDGIETLFGLGGNDYIEGNQDMDVLVGGEGNDTLLGGIGNDTLWHNDIGNEDDDYENDDGTIVGADTLKGGAGNDTYFVGEGDIVEDSDGEGQVQFLGKTLSDGYHKLSQTGNNYTSVDDAFLYTYDPATLILTVQEIPSNGPLSEGGVFTIKNFTSGNLGITLPESGVPGVILSGTTGDDTITYQKRANDNVYLSANEEIDLSSYADQAEDVETALTDLQTQIDTLDGQITALDASIAQHIADGTDASADIASRATLITTRDGLQSQHQVLSDEYTERKDQLFDQSGQTAPKTILGLAGDDKITLDGLTNLQAEGGDGKDQLITHSEGSTLQGGADNDALATSAKDTKLFGDAGDDLLRGGDNADQLFGGTDNDIISGGLSADYIHGGDGGDVLSGNEGDDPVFGGHGDDIITGGAGNDQLFGGANNDVIFGDVKSINYFFTATLAPGAAPNIPVNWTGPNNGFNADNLYEIDYGNDYVGLTPVVSGDYFFLEEASLAESGIDLIYGGSGDDYILAGEGNDIIDGGADNDFIEGEGGDDEIHGGIGNDILYGDINKFTFDVFSAPSSTGTVINGGSYTIYDRQYLNGPDAGGNDMLYGDDGVDRLLGGVGDDLLDGGQDNTLDVLQGGADNDTYQFGFDYGVELIHDISGAADKVKFMAGVTADNVALSADDSRTNLIITLKIDGEPTGDQLILVKWFQGQQVETLEFDSGLRWSAADVEQMTGVSAETNPQNPVEIEKILTGTSGVDVSTGTDQNDEIYSFKGNDFIAAGGGHDRIYGGDDDDQLQGNDGDDLLQGDAGDDTLFGQADNDQLFGGAGDDQLQGNEGNDSLTGGTGDDTLFGGTGDDTYFFSRGDGSDQIVDSDGSADQLRFGEDILPDDISLSVSGNNLIIDVLTEGQATTDSMTVFGWFTPANQIESIAFANGDSWDVAAITARLPDSLTLADNTNSQGGDGNSTFTFHAADAFADGFNVTLEDTGGIDTLDFKQAVLNVPNVGNFYATPSIQGASRVGDDLVLDVSIDSQIGGIPTATGQVQVTNYYTSTGFIENIVFPAGALNDPNLAPMVNDSVTDQIIDLDVAYNYQLASNTFVDSAFDRVVLTATLADGTDLPAWLNFDAATQTFSGMPLIGDAEVIDIVVTATDAANNSSSIEFNLNVGNINLAPTLVTANDDQETKVTQPFSYTIPTDTFSDVNLNDTLTLSATQLDGSDLPSWLTFNANTQTFNGTPLSGDVGALNVRVTATDSGGLSSSDIFTLTINANTAPVAVDDHVAAKVDTPDGNSFTFDVLANDTDVDSDDEPSNFSLDSVMLNGAKGTVSIVDNKLVFDAGTDFDTLKAGDNEQVTVDYTMSDDEGGVSSGSTTITVAGTQLVQNASVQDSVAFVFGGDSVSSAGDVNGDGLDDIIIGDPSNEVAYVVFGKTGGFASPINLDSLNGSDGFAVFDSTYGETGHSVSGAGDINGDGFDDVIIGSPENPVGVYYGAYYSHGVNHIIYGKSSGFSASINIDTLTSSQGFNVQDYSSSFVYLGSSVSDAGDINGDGFDDFVVAGRGYYGYGSVVFGRNTGFPNTLNNVDLDGTDGFNFRGDSPGENPLKVSGAGDINGDGFDDLIIGAANSTVNGVSSDAAYVIFGKKSGFSTGTRFISLNGLSGNDGFRLTTGSTVQADFGKAVSGIGDVNGDGLADFAVGSENAINNKVVDVIFGSKDSFGDTLNVSQLDGRNGFSLFDSEDNHSISGAGDVNGDGLDDFIIGTYSSGESYVIFGQDQAVFSNLNLADIDGTNGIKLSSLVPGDGSGRSVSGAGDVNGDGFDDLIIGAPSTAGGQGASRLVFGRDFNNQIEYLGTDNADVINVASDNSRVFTRGGDDTVNIFGNKDVYVNTGSGYNTINIGGKKSTGFRTNSVSLSGSGAGRINITETINNRYIVGLPGLMGGGSSIFDVYTARHVKARDIRIRRGSLIVDIEGSVELHFGSVDTDDLINGQSPFAELNIGNNLSFTYEELLALGFDADGTSGNDVLIGTEVVDRINGFAGDDELRGGNGDDVLDGGLGNDRLFAGEGNDLIIGGLGDDAITGGAGDDTYQFTLGDGKDSITDTSGLDQVVFGAGLFASDINVSQSDDNLVIQFNDDLIRIEDWFNDTQNHVEKFVFTEDNVAVLTDTDIEALLSGPLNQAPQLNGDITDQSINDGSFFSVSLSPTHFSDPDTGDSLTISAFQADGSALPAWLSFDAATLTLSGTPAPDDIGLVELMFTAADDLNESISDTFNLTVNKTPPISVIPLSDATVIPNAGHAVSDAGDVNGDGFADILIDGAYGYSSYIVFGDADGIENNIDVNNLDGSNGFKLQTHSYGNGPTTISGVGDMNGDGFADVIIGVPYGYNTGTSSSSNDTYVVFGKETGFDATFDLHAVDGINGFQITGSSSSDRFGVSVSGAGDVNGDGLTDLIVGANAAYDNNSGEDGVSYVVFGKTSGFNATLSVDDLDGSNGFSLAGVYSGGRSVNNAGDVNGDGFDDVIIGAHYAYDSDTGYDGKSFVVFGKEDGFASHIDLNNLNGSNGFSLTGIDKGGYIVNTVGDVNGDGIDDVIVGTTGGDSYVVFGKDTGFNANIDLSALNGTNGFNLQAISRLDHAGSAGDVNGDGFDDIIIGSSRRSDYDYSTYTGLKYGGESYVVFGGSDFNSSITLDDLNGENGFKLPGTTYYGYSGNSVSTAGDINGDGFDDLLVAQKGYYGYDENSYVIFGSDLRREIAFEGGSADDTLTGTDENEILIGGQGNDVIDGGVGNDVMIGGAGDDVLVYDVADTLRVDGGSGNDTLRITDSGITLDLTTLNTTENYQLLTNIEVIELSSGTSNNTLKLDELDLVRLSETGNTLRVDGHSGDTVMTTSTEGWVSNGTVVINNEAYTEYQKGQAVLQIENTIQQQIGDLGGSNNPPVLDAGINDQSANEDQVFSFTVPVDAFADPDVGDTLTYTATLADDSVLPAWLSFDAATQTFSGTPDNDDVGNLAVKVTATDTGGLSVSDTYSLTVNNINDAPVVSTAIADQVTNEDVAFSFTVPANTFADDDVIHADSLTYTATLADDSALPAWLSFDAATQTFSGTPTNGDVGSLDVKVTATDGSLVSVSDTYSLTVNNVNDAPVVSTAIADQVTNEDVAFSFTVPANTFADDDVIHADSLTYTATLADDSALPAWLSFDAATQTFSGTPTNGDVGSLDVKVTATDGSLASVSDTYSLTVNNVNDAPLLGNNSLTVGEDETVVLSPGDLSATDIDNDDATLSFTVSNVSNGQFELVSNAGVAISSFTQQQLIDGAVQFVHNGSENVPAYDINVSDGDLSDSGSAVITFNANSNDAPTVNAAIIDQVTNEDTVFSFTVPANTFDDVDVGDSLTYSATLADDSALPGWLSFDAGTQTFSGTPDNGDVGSVDVKVTATDTGGLSVSDIYSLTVNNVNDAPVVSTAIVDQVTDEDAPFSFTVPANTFDDVDVGDSLMYSASLGDDSALPSWLSFDAGTQTFSGTPDNDDVGNVDVKVMATDTGGLSVSESFSVTINNVNDAPVVSTAIADQATDEDAPFSFTVPANTFSDDDSIHGDSLTYSATLADDSALPGWLSFDAGTQTFSGTPTNGDVGSVDVKVTATDGSLVSVSDTYSLTVNNINDAPVVANAIVDQVTNEDTPFSFTVPANTFDDVDVGDSLTYTATLADDSALPGWLSFDGATQTFSGTPTNGDVGSVDVKVTATDGSLASVSETYALIVNSASNLAPVLANQILNQTTDELAPFSFTVPANTFTDPNAGDSLSYTATLSDDSALPSWLSFDAATQTFSGRPADSDTGPVDIKITATDTGGLSEDDTFTLTVNDLNSLSGSGGNDTLIGSEDHDAIMGLDGDDTIEGKNGDDILDGGAGNDRLEGNGGNDTLIGGTGDDMLIGTTQNDTYYFEQGWGQDIIENQDWNDTGSNIDTIKFGAGITPADILVTRGLSYLYLTHATTGDKITITHYYTYETRQLNAVAFADGTVWDQADIEGMFAGATEGDDAVLYGSYNATTGFDSTIDGLGGNDTIWSGVGDDVIIGGSGNDLLRGYGGDDIYHYEQNWGQDEILNYDYTAGSNDTIRFGTGIATTDIQVSRDYNDLTLSHVNGVDQITLKSYYHNAAFQVDNIEFADNTVWDKATIEAMLPSATTGDDTLYGSFTDDVLTGLAGNDLLNGKKGNDTFYGGTGNDTLKGEDGDDTYHYGLGDEQDSIYDTSGDDTVVFDNIDSDDLWFWQEGNDLRIGVLATQDRLTIENWYIDPNERVETFETSSESLTLLETNVQQLVDAMAVFDVQAAGNLNVPQADIDSVQSVIAASWA